MATRPAHIGARIHLAFVICVIALTAGLAGGSSASAATGSLPYTGGQDAARNAQPFVAGLRKPGDPRFFCTGTLVTKSWVLTAAHCVDEATTPAKVEVVLGDTNLSDSIDPAETHPVDRLVVHPRWGGDAGDSHDVALVHLTTDSSIAPVRLGYPRALSTGVKTCVEKAKRALLFQRTWIPGSCVAMRGTGLGWGRTPSTADSSSLTLREAAVKVLDWPKGTFWRAKAGACPGDSGGPLVVPGDDGTPRQIGVASHAQHGGGWFDWLVGGRCSSKGFDFYSDVSSGTLNAWVGSVTGVRDHRS